MSQIPAPAKLQDGQYGIGGSYLNYLGDLTREELAILEIEVPIVIPPRLPWYIRLWIFLNTDILILWRQWRER